MEYNFKKIFCKRLAAFVVILSVLSSAFYLPIFTPRTQAIFGIGDIVIDIEALKRSIIDGIAMALAQELIDEMVRETVDWANNGFDGNPAYATNLGGFIGNVADGVAGEFILGSDLAFLCSPFQTQIRLSLQRYYVGERRFQCTLSEVVDNIEDFYDDFNKGGWDAWFSMTQNDTNNPYGAYLQAQLELDSRVASAVGLEREQLNWNSGFLSYSECLRRNGDTGECLERGPVKTPGVTIKAQLDQVLPSGLSKLITVNHVEQLIGAFATGLLKRYVFSDQGLFTSNSDNYLRGTSNTPQPINQPDLCNLARDIPGVDLTQLDCGSNTPPFTPPPYDPTEWAGFPPPADWDQEAMTPTGTSHQHPLTVGYPSPFVRSNNFEGINLRGWPSASNTNENIHIERGKWVALGFIAGQASSCLTPSCSRTSGGIESESSPLPTAPFVASISRYPGDFSPELGACLANRGGADFINWSYTTGNNLGCVLVPGEQYYLNIINGTRNDLSVSTCNIESCGAFFTFR